MRLTTLIIFVCCLSANAKGVAQTVNLHFTKADAETIFREIYKQTGYQFLYMTDQLEKIPKITIDESNISIEKALNTIFKGTSVLWTISRKNIVLRDKPIELPQPQTDANELLSVKGKVINERRDPIEGVSISVKGTNVTTVTNAKGEFGLQNINSGSTLIFSSINTEVAELKVENSTDLVVTLKSKINTLSEVTIQYNTGFQQVAKERATGSFELIDNKALNQQVGTSILDRLNGMSTAILFDDSKTKTDQKRLNINLRGLSTINGPQDPLIILDNFPYEGDLNNINPNLIENVTILKDAAAASIWGTKAGNGVIVITTKKGRFNQPVRVETNSTVQVTEKPDLFAIPTMSNADYVDVEQMLYNKGFFSSTINNGYSALTPVVEALYKRDKGIITSAQADALINLYKRNDNREDYLKYFYQRAVKQQYAINVYGGSNNVAYILSAGYDKNLSELNAGYDRLNLRMENTYKPFKFLQVTGGVAYNRSKTSNGRPGYGSVTVNNRAIPYYEFTDGSNNPNSLASTYRDSWTDTVGAGRLLNWKYYPLEDYKHNLSSATLSELIGNIGIEAQIIPGLTADIKYQYQRQQVDNVNLNDTGSYSTRSIINQYSQVNRATGKVTYIIPVGSILKTSSSIIESHNLRGQLNFNRKWHLHEVAAIVGGEMRNIKNNSNGNTLYGYNNDVLTSGNTDYLNAYPTLPNGSSSYVPSGVSISEKLNRFLSFFGNIAYTFNAKYTISGSVRKDASNLFGVHTNDKWNPFWSTGIAWNISNESFYKIGFLKLLKFRATYGTSGNVDQSKSAETVIGNFGTNSITGLMQSNIKQFYNPDLKWERVSTLNAGIDFAFKNQIISGSIEYYHKHGSDLFGTVPVDYTVGLGLQSITKNVSDMEGNGVDLTIRSINLESKDLSWTSSLFFSYSMSKTTKYDPTTFSSIAGKGNGISTAIGKPLYAIASYRWGGLDANGNPQGYVDGKLSTNYSAISASIKSIDSFVYNGPSSPPFFGSIGNTISYKGIALSFNLQYKLGYYFRRNVLSYSALFSGSNSYPDYAERWQNPGDELKTTVPSLIYPAVAARDGFYQNSEITVERADNIRLQFVNLSYDFKNILLKNRLFKAAQLYINASNLGIIWRANKRGIDPDYQILPSQKAYAIGLRLNF